MMIRQLFFLILLIGLFVSQQANAENISNKWRDYEAGTLVAPCVVQHDVNNGVHQVWIWTGKEIIGPKEVSAYDEAALLDAAMSYADTSPPEQKDPTSSLVDALNSQVSDLKTQVSDLTKYNTKLIDQLQQARIEPIKNDLSIEVK